MKKYFVFFGLVCSSLLQAQPCVWRHVETSSSFTLGIKADSTLWGWGSAYDLRVPSTPWDNGPIYLDHPVQLDTSAQRWVSVLAKNGIGWATRSDGTIYQVGFNRQVLFLEAGQAKEYVQLEPGARYWYGVKKDGTLWAKGPYAQVPSQIGIGDRWIKVSSSGGYTVALRADSTLWAWEENTSTAFTQVGAGHTWKYLVSESSKTLAIRSDGTVWYWISSLDAAPPKQLGKDANWESVTGVQSQYTGSYSYMVGIKTDGSLEQWEMSAQPYLVPIQNYAPGQHFVRVQSAQEFRMATRSDGTYWVWGVNTHGTMGLGPDKVGNYLPFLTELPHGACPHLNFKVPDPVLDSLLHVWYPSCFDKEGYLMLSCARNIKSTAMNISGKHLHDVDGVQFFTHLTSLDCSHNDLRSLPTLPPLLTSLKASQNCFCPNIPTAPSSYHGTWEVSPNKPSCADVVQIPSDSIFGFFSEDIYYISGRVNYFDGVDDYIEIQGFTKGEGPFTISFWANPEQLPASLSFPALKNIVNKWSHIAVTCTGTNGKVIIYVNGVQKVSGMMPVTATSAFESFAIGMSGSDFYKGYMFDLRLWDDVRSAEEIKKDMRSFVVDAYDPHLIGYIRMWNDMTGFSGSHHSYAAINHETQEKEMIPSARYFWSVPTDMLIKDAHSPDAVFYVPDSYYSTSDHKAHVVITNGQSCAYQELAIHTEFDYTGEDNRMENEDPAPQDRDNVVSVHPNPSKEKTYLFLPHLQETVTVAILDVSGKTWQTFQVSQEQTEIETTSLPEGMYFLHFQFQGETKTQKLQVLK